MEIKHHASHGECDSEGFITGGQWTSSENAPRGFVASIYFHSILIRHSFANVPLIVALGVFWYNELCSKRYGNHATSLWYNEEDNAQLGVWHSGRGKAVMNQRDPYQRIKRDFLVSELAETACPYQGNPHTSTWSMREWQSQPGRFQRQIQCSSCT
jgi:hypothetical protein